MICKSINTIFFFALILLSPIMGKGQEKTEVLMQPSNQVKIDGRDNEWRNNTRNEEPSLGWSYSLANNHDHLYLVITIIRPEQQKQLLSNGITLGINPKGKKKTTYSLCFPAPNDQGKTSFERGIPVGVSQLVKVRVDGYKSIKNQILLLNNPYDFQAALAYDDRHTLLCELKVPLKYFQPDDFDNKVWAFNIKLNRSPAPEFGDFGDEKKDDSGKSRYHNGIGGGGRPGDEKKDDPRSQTKKEDMELYKAVGFWQIFKINY